MFIEEIAHGVFDAVYDRLRRKVEAGAVEKEISHNDDVYQKLRLFFKNHFCDRLLIIQYHNGSNYYSGRSIQKTSCTYEVVYPGVSSIIRDIQNILSSEDPEFHSSLFKNKIIKYSKVDECPNPVKRLRLIERGVKSYFAVAISDLGNNLLGYICIEFTSAEHEISPAHEEALIELSNQLSGYLSVGNESRVSNSILTEWFLKLGILVLFLLATGELIDIFYRAQKLFNFFFGL